MNKQILTVCCLCMALSSLSACGTNASVAGVSVTKEISNDGSAVADGFTELNVPLSDLAAFEAPAKAAIAEQLGVAVPEEAEITSSFFDEPAASLTFTWTCGETNGIPSDYFSATFENANVKKGTGDILYVHSQGAAVSLLTETLTAAAEKALADQLGCTVPAELRFTVDVSVYDGARDVLFTWEPQGVEPMAGKYYAGYEHVSADYSQGTLVYLEAASDGGKSLLTQGTYSDAEIQTMQQAAESFVGTHGLDVTSFVRYDSENPGEKGNTAFYFRGEDAAYQSVIVYVNAESRVTGFALSPNPPEENG